MNFTIGKYLRYLTTLIITPVLLMPVSVFGLEAPQTDATVDDQERFPPTWAIRFVCDQSSGIPTLFVHTRRHSLSIAEWRSDHFQPAGYDPLTRCHKVAERFRQFYNCGLLQPDNIFAEISTTTQGNPSPALFVRVDDRANRRCPGLDRQGSGKLLLFMVEPTQDVNQILTRLKELGEGRPESLDL